MTAFRKVEVTRSLEGKTFTLSAMVSGPMIVDLTLVKTVHPRGLIRKLFNLAPRSSVHAMPEFRTTGGGGMVCDVSLRGQR